MSPSIHPAKKTSSGEHPAVVGYHKKLDSIAEHAAVELEELDKAIQQYLEQVKTPLPPPPDRT